MDKFLFLKPVDFFKNKRDGLQQQRTTMSKYSTVSKQCLEASYVVAHRIAKLGKPHTIAETLILPAEQQLPVQLLHSCQMTLCHAEYQISV